MVGNVEGLAVIDSLTSLRGAVVETWGNKVGVVGLPQTHMHIESRGKGRDLHVVGPLAGLAHLLDMVLKLPLQISVGEGGRVGTGVQGGRGLSLGVTADTVDRHVLAVEVRVILHVLDGGHA